MLTSSTDFTNSFSRSFGGHGYTLVPGDWRRRSVGLRRLQPDDGTLERAPVSAYSTTMGVSWGGPGFLPVPADFDGDRKIDIAVYQPATAWMALRSTTSSRRC